MPQKGLTDQQCKEAADAYAACGRNIAAASESLGMNRATFTNRLNQARRRGMTVGEPANDNAERAPRDRVNLIDMLRKTERELDAERRSLAIMRKFEGVSLAPPRWLTPKVSGKGERAIATMFLSDLHLDEVVKPEEIGWVNAYDRELAESRLRRFFGNGVRLMRDYINGIRIEGLVLPLGGDIVSGNIHEELEATNDDNILSTCIHWSEQLAAGIRMLRADLGVPIHVPCVVGNHGRIRQKLRFKGRVKDNYDWLIYRLLAIHFADDKGVTFDVSESTEARWTAYGTRYHLSHGDQFHGGSGIAGIATPIALGDHRKRKREQATGNPYDVLLLGHWHQLRNMGNIIINGSLKGYDEYAAGHNFEFERPQQAFWLTDPKHGKTIWAPIRVDSDDEAWRARIPANRDKVIGRAA